MEKYKKLNIIATVSFVVAIILLALTFYLGDVLHVDDELLFPVTGIAQSCCTVSIVLSVISVVEKRAIWGIILLILSLLLLPIVYVVIYVLVIPNNYYMDIDTLDDIFQIPL